MSLLLYMQGPRLGSASIKDLQTGPVFPEHGISVERIIARLARVRRRKEKAKTRTLRSVLQSLYQTAGPQIYLLMVF